MAEKRTTYVNHEIVATSSDRAQIVFGATTHQDKFSISSYTLNKIADEDSIQHDFPGNISPEGYFYSPFYEITLKELDDELQSIPLKRINFTPSTASVSLSSVTVYHPEIGLFETKDITQIYVISPITYDFLIGQPFSIYDVMEEVTYRGHLDGFSSHTSGCQICITTNADINSADLKGDGEGARGQSRYIISLLEENAPEYAEYIPSTGKLVWRGPKKMSDLASDSPIYNMPFTNGRLYIHKNINVYVRRQDPHGGYKLFRPALNNPLRRFQVEGDDKLNFDYIQTIIDSMVDAC